MVAGRWMAATCRVLIWRRSAKSRRHQANLVEGLHRGRSHCTAYLLHDTVGGEPGRNVESPRTKLDSPTDRGPTRRLTGSRRRGSALLELGAVKAARRVVGVPGAAMCDTPGGTGQPSARALRSVPLWFRPQWRSVRPAITSLADQVAADSVTAVTWARTVAVTGSGEAGTATTGSCA